MEDAALEDLKVFIPPLLRALEALGFAARHLDPPTLAQLQAAMAEPEAALRAARPRLDGWPDALGGVRERLQGVADLVLTAFDELAAAGDMRGVYRALRLLPRAQEALYPLADGLPPVSRFFLSSDRREDPELAARIAEAPPRDDVGLCRNITTRSAPGRLWSPCMVELAMVAASCGAGSPMPGRAAPSWPRRPRSATPGRCRATTSTAPTSPASSTTSTPAGTSTRRGCC
jgi:hypothetical protein